MADLTQSATLELLEHQEITHPGNVVGPDVNCATWLSIQITVWLASIETTANAAGVAVILQGSSETSGNDWFDLYRFTGPTVASETEVMTATEPTGEKVLAVASTTNLTVGDLIYIKDDTAVTDGEWHEIVAVVTNTSVAIMDGLAVEKVANDDIYDQASRWSIRIELDGIKRIRACVVHQAATGSDQRVKVTGVAATDIE